ncbi:MAG: NAD(P)-dependent oxidoreductase [Curvibacter sp. RIFCSPHIGHO2_12_FULL_63_18]|uniref:NAD-dependent epimerase/dehydratase family protein n=1 Tax=Rhodoferax sp. TaxID=50421 RepID=UPI0008CE98EA|nr:NAD-dependent epimerase/dehydratase family protein [Rhodoferax sp.]OGO95769.1 MAG: NAD(P)-dependent oxidoreductase [Curvibacter sp. GWA2_63_95]OGP05752.1 MAG: NAD(P)-dependent oxidoreductase [Curvibacter sp. RIFCSPHIGHO2_12_FULL_63_18]HCX81549.1 NAD(P)-dependent oxidoreductase [Rhodoferax sp.]
MPSNQSPLGALPSRFRKQRVLVLGCGDVGVRMVKAQGVQARWLALTSSAERIPALRAMGATPLLGNLDKPQTLRRLAGLAQRVLYLAPPPFEGWVDSRALALARVLRRRTAPASVVYGSTSGVYGDCQGEWVPETRAVAPQTPRAQRRVHAEYAMRFWGRSSGVRVSVIRIPGIYAPDREGGTPQTRLAKGTPVLQAADDVYTNHIHADDLARACWRALWLGLPQRLYNVSDHSELKMGDYFDLAADLYGLPRPPRVSRTGAREQLPVMLLSFMDESRRLVNTRMVQELRLTLRYPSVHTGLRSSA